MNTCGRICVHKSGSFVVVSNRGHQSIAIFRVTTKGAKRGELRAVGYFHTRGETPRHFQFDASGQFLLVANQDSDSIAVFNFNLSSGAITYTGNEYRVLSPNFVCCCPMRDTDIHNEFETHEEEDAILTAGSAGIEVSNIAMVNNSQPIIKMMTEHDCLSSSSEISATIPNMDIASKDKSRDLEFELERARKEIDELKQQIARMST